MVGLVPAIHRAAGATPQVVLAIAQFSSAKRAEPWVAGTSPAKTEVGYGLGQKSWLPVLGDLEDRRPRLKPAVMLAVPQHRIETSLCAKFSHGRVNRRQGPLESRALINQSLGYPSRQRIGKRALRMKWRALRSIL